MEVETQIESRDATRACIKQRSVLSIDATLAAKREKQSMA